MQTGDGDQKIGDAYGNVGKYLSIGVRAVGTMNYSLGEADVNQSELTVQLLGLHAGFIGFNINAPAKVYNDWTGWGVGVTVGPGLYFSVGNPITATNYWETVNWGSLAATDLAADQVFAENGTMVPAVTVYAATPAVPVSTVYYDRYAEGYLNSRSTYDPVSKQQVSYAQYDSDGRLDLFAEYESGEAGAIQTFDDNGQVTSSFWRTNDNQWGGGVTLAGIQSAQADYDFAYLSYAAQQYSSDGLFNTIVNTNAVFGAGFGGSNLARSVIDRPQPSELRSPEQLVIDEDALFQALGLADDPLLFQAVNQILRIDLAVEASSDQILNDNSAQMVDPQLVAAYAKVTPLPVPEPEEIYSSSWYISG